MNIFLDVLSAFTTDMFTAMKWVHLIIDATIPEPNIDLDLKLGPSYDDDDS